MLLLVSIRGSSENDRPWSKALPLRLRLKSNPTDALEKVVDRIGAVHAVRAAVDVVPLGVARYSER